MVDRTRKFAKIGSRVVVIVHQKGEGMGRKVVVGMSGGVDSSVAAYLLKEQGYEVIGVNMKMWHGGDTDTAKENSACGMSAVEDAEKVADMLGIPFYVADFEKEFKSCVVDYFVEEYLRGRTPNPCNACNRFVKWEALLQKGAAMGADYIATGHYARIERLPGGRYAVKNSVTAKKDQTYALYGLTQEQLSHTLMPDGDYTKEEIRDIAVKLGLPVAAKPDSQDICFIPDGDYAAFLEREAPERLLGEGDFVDMDGRVLGRHKGITHYTIGQRKGLGLSMGHPVFVTGIRKETNEVLVGENEDLYARQILCEKINYMAMEDLPEPRKAVAKVRYAHKGSACLLEKLADGRVKCTFDEPVRAPAPGQAAVFYEDGYVLGGGTICGTLP